MNRNRSYRYQTGNGSTTRVARPRCGSYPPGEHIVRSQVLESRLFVNGLSCVGSSVADALATPHPEMYGPLVGGGLFVRVSLNVPNPEPRLTRLASAERLRVRIRAVAVGACGSHQNHTTGALPSLGHERHRSRMYAP